MEFSFEGFRSGRQYVAMKKRSQFTIIFLGALSLGYVTEAFAFKPGTSSQVLVPEILKSESYGEAQSVMPLNKKPQSRATSKTEVDFSQIGYLSSSTEYFKSRGSSSSNIVIGMSVDDQTEVSDRCKSFIKGRGFFSVEEDVAYINPKQAYFDCKFGERFSLKVGRVKRTWSRADNHWKMGEIEPRFVWNRLRSQSQGLLGLFVDQKINSRISVVGFTSPFFIPDFGSSYVEKDRRVESANPWFRPPPKKVNLIGSVRPLKSHIEAAKSKDVVNHGSAGVHVSWKEKQWQVDGGWLYKPMNQLALGVPVILTTEDEVDVTIKPTVVYHRVVFGEVAWIGHKRSAWASISHESPDNIPAYDGWLVQSFRPATTLSGYVEKEISMPWELGTGQVYGGYYRVWGGTASDRGDFAGATSYFESRHNLGHAVQFGLKQPFQRKFLGRPWATGFEFIYDLDQHGVILTTEAAVHWSRDLSISLMGDFLGLLGDPREGDKRFISDYRANDYFQMRLSYVY